MGLNEDLGDRENVGSVAVQIARLREENEKLLLRNIRMQLELEIRRNPPANWDGVIEWD